MGRWEVKLCQLRERWQSAGGASATLRQALRRAQCNTQVDAHEPGLRPDGPIGASRTSATDWGLRPLGILEVKLCQLRERWQSAGGASACAVPDTVWLYDLGYVSAPSPASDLRWPPFHRNLQVMCCSFTCMTGHPDPLHLL
jgi:hypothetical protein